MAALINANSSDALSAAYAEEVSRSSAEQTYLGAIEALSPARMEELATTVHALVPGPVRERIFPDTPTNPRNVDALIRTLERTELFSAVRGCIPDLLPSTDSSADPSSDSDVVNRQLLTPAMSPQGREIKCPYTPAEVAEIRQADPGRYQSLLAIWPTVSSLASAAASGASAVVSGASKAVSFVTNKGSAKSTNTQVGEQDSNTDKQDRAPETHRSPHVPLHTEEGFASANRHEEVDALLAEMLAEPPAPTTTPALELVGLTSCSPEHIREAMEIDPHSLKTLRYLLGTPEHLVALGLDTESGLRLLAKIWAHHFITPVSGPAHRAQEFLLWHSVKRCMLNPHAADATEVRKTRLLKVYEKIKGAKAAARLEELSQDSYVDPALLRAERVLRSSQVVQLPQDQGSMYVWSQSNSAPAEPRPSSGGAQSAAPKKKKKKSKNRTGGDEAHGKPQGKPKSV
jgi:hypothetical protein